MRIALILIAIVLTSGIPQSSLVGHWKFNENAGTIAWNNRLPTKNGTLTNGPVFAKMQRGNCVYLDGVNDYVEIPDADQYSFGDGSTDKPFTISAWVYNQKASGQSFRLASKFATGVAAEWLVQTRPTGTYSMHLYITSGANVSAEATGSNAANDVNLWTHLAFTYDGSKAYTGIKIYRNGVAYTSYTSIGSGSYTGMPNSSEPITIGKFTTTYAQGYIQDFQIHNRELNATEIRNMYVESYNKINH